jgi:hypothetical protein
MNATTAAVDMPISIAGLTGQDVTLVFTNQSGTAQTMPTVALTASQLPTVAASAIQWDDGVSAAKGRIADYNRDGWAAKAGARGTGASLSTFGATPPLRAAYTVGDTRNWYHEDNSSRATTLVRTDTTADGTVVNFWVEDTENNPLKVSTAIVAALEAGFVPAGKIYDLLKQTGGPVWGPHVYTDLISGAVRSRSTS